MTRFAFLNKDIKILSNKSIDVEVHETLVVQLANLGIKQGASTLKFSREYVSGL